MSIDRRYQKLFAEMDEGFCIIEFFDGPHGPLSDYVHIDANAAYARNAGIADVVGQKLREMVGDEADAWVARYGEVLRTGVPIRFEQELVATGRYLELSAFRIGSAADRQVAVLFKDVTERRRAERQLQLSEEKFRALANATSDVLYQMTPDWQVMQPIDGRGLVPDNDHANPNWLTENLYAEDLSMVQARIDAAIAGKAVFQMEHRVRRPDGTTGWTFSRAVPILDGSGEIAEWFGAASDITERRRAEDHLRLVVNELNHRVKNHLAMVQAIAAQTFRNVDDLADAQQRLTARIMALARANDLLTGERTAGVSLHDAVAQALDGHCDHSGRCYIEGPDIALSPKTALALTLALHELSTNALKYGAWSVAGGQVALRWEIRGHGPEARLWLEWRESGGPPVLVPQRRGFGSRLIERGLAGEMRGSARLDFEPTGLVCVVDAPLEVEDMEEPMT